MSKSAKSLAFILGFSLGMPSIAAVHREKPQAGEQILIHKSGPVPSGIYNLRRPHSALPNARNSLHRKPRAKPASDTVAFDF